MDNTDKDVMLWVRNNPEEAQKIVDQALVSKIGQTVIADQSEIVSRAIKKLEILEEFEALRPYIQKGLENRERPILFDNPVTEQQETLTTDNFLDCEWAELFDRFKNPENPVFEIITDARTALDESIDRTTIKRADSVLYPLDKPNEKIWKLFEKDTKGQVKFNMAMSGTRQIIPAFYSINFDKLSSDLQISKRLTVFDKLVYCAIAALFNAGNTVITLQQICYAAGYIGNPGKDIKERVNAAVTKMASAWITFDNEMESTVYKYKHFKYDGSLLPMERGTAYVNGQFVNAAIHIFREPPMITFAKQRGQIATFDIKLLQAPLNKTDENLLVQDYLLERIAREKNKKTNKAKCCRMLYKTIYNNIGIPDRPTTNTDRQRKKRAPGKIEKYLQYYQEQGFITLYTIQKGDGITIYWRELSDAEKESIIKKNEAAESAKRTGKS